MKKMTYLIIALLFVGTFAFAQGDVRYDITGFEGVDFDWAYSGNSIVASQIEWSDFQGGASPHEGEQMLFVEWDNSISGTWQWSQLNFMEPVDLTGATEIHMWVYVIPEETSGPFAIRIDLPDGTSLGEHYVPEDQFGQWYDLSWQMDHITATQKISALSYWGGFVCPDNATDYGMCYIDDVYGLRPAGTPEEYDEIMVWSLDDEDPNTGEPFGWTVGTDGAGIMVGMGEFDPSEGTNFAEMQLNSGWANNVRTTNAMGDYDNWPAVLEIMADARVAQDISGGWVNFGLVLQSNADDWDPYGEMGIAGAKDDWQTVLWRVDMSRHADAFNPDVADRWFQLVFITNQDAQDAGKYVYFDNVRVVVPKAGTDVMDWALF